MVYSAIISYWAETGGLPQSLASIRSSLPKDLVSSWEYFPQSDPPSFTLSTGNYNRCGWSLDGMFRSRWSSQLRSDSTQVQENAARLLSLLLRDRQDTGSWPA